MRLVKYCKVAHNIALGGPSIQLGTLQYYRELDPSFTISDPGEGTRQLSFPPGLSFQLTDELSERVFGGSVSGGGSPLEVIAKEGAFFKSMTHNVYVFCVTCCSDELPPSLDEARSFDDQYDSFYEIPNPDRFKRVLADSLLETFSLSLLAPHSLVAVLKRPLKELMFNVQVIDRPVDYIASREKYIERAEQLNETESLAKAMEAALFTKEKRDQCQREYRFAFILSQPSRGVLSVGKEPIRIPVSRFAGLCYPGQ